MIEYLDDLRTGIWSELKTKKPVDIYRRNLQKNYVLNMLALIKETKENSNILGMMFGVPEEAKPVINTSDIGSYLVYHLQNLRQDILTTLPSVTDKETKDHLKYIADQIKTEVIKYY